MPLRSFLRGGCGAGPSERREAAAAATKEDDELPTAETDDNELFGAATALAQWLLVVLVTAEVVWDDEDEPAADLATRLVRTRRLVVDRVDSSFS